MRLALYSTLLLGFLAAHLNADIIDAIVPAKGQNSFHYTFTLDGFDLLQNQALDLEFDSSVYLSLSNPVAPATLSTTVLQPDNPPGAPGDYLLLALISNPSLSPESLSIDVTLIGHKKPGHLKYLIDQFDSQGHFVGVVSSGITSASPIPEPASVSLIGLGMLVAGVWRSRWRGRDDVRNRVGRSS